MNLVVVGDALLDVDVVGSVNRVCPDGPAPVLDLEAERPRAGGAGLAAVLAAADGACTTLVTALADDAEAAVLRSLLDAVDVVASRSPGTTVVKSRLRAGEHSLARVDRGGSDEPPTVSDAMVAAVRRADAVLVSDYGRGMAADPRLRDLLAAAARRVPVVWDPHPCGPEPVAGVRLFTPNLSEARKAASVAGAGLDAACRAAETLRDRYRLQAVAVTLGNQGALLHLGGRTSVVVPAPRVAVLDPCGAGDRFASSVAVNLLRGVALDDAVAHGVVAAAEFVSVRGTRDPRQSLAVVRARGGTVVATGGCFDILHTGHARTLLAARQLGDFLVVCLNSDASVRRLKGSARPLNNERDRAEMLRALGCVDAVVLFDDDTPCALLRELRPDVWVKGGDYSAETLPETGVLAEWGGRSVVVPYHAGRSTTRLADLLVQPR
ncbi:MAG: D-glycero-beta-D-manno-heptose 1-phosphate adenylyltransferase [Kutzneria sp.]|nr:D-glycero-beta-D-manno-heptose 1-phosphate adenylyltransferase [Kutzneria sp.]MBV9846574.1 D-glycero-beta-D-manno-heptose 1-phosphate adenylyltransferase [Kutzneria sp.]